MKYYVYYLIDPRTELPFYIGKGKNDRAETHLHKSSKTVNERKDQVISEIRNEGLEPLIKKIKFFDDEKEAYFFEEKEILKFGRRDVEPDGILTNITLHSRPPSQKGKKRIFTELHKQRLSEATKGKPKNYTVWNANKTKETDNRLAKAAHNRSLAGNNHQIGTHLSKETKEKISRALKGKSFTDLHDFTVAQEIKEKMSKKKKGKTWEEIYGVEGAKKRREAIKARKNNDSV
jgi:hypothetical protein